MDKSTAKRLNREVEHILTVTENQPPGEAASLMIAKIKAVCMVGASRANNGSDLAEWIDLFLRMAEKIAAEVHVAEMKRRSNETA